MHVILNEDLFKVWVGNDHIARNKAVIEFIKQKLVYSDKNEVDNAMMKVKLFLSSLKLKWSSNKGNIERFKINYRNWLKQVFVTYTKEVSTYLCIFCFNLKMHVC